MFRNDDDEGTDLQKLQPGPVARSRSKMVHNRELTNKQASKGSFDDGYRRKNNRIQ